MRRIALLIVVLLIGLAGSAAKAQSTPSATCDLTIVSEELSNFKPSGDNTKDIAALAKARDDIGQAIIACQGMKFEGTANKILGPIDLPKGLFLITLKTNGYGSAEGKVLDGTCDNNPGDTSAFLLGALSSDNPNVRAQSLTSEGCKFTVDIELVTAPWTLTIEPLQ